MKIANPTHANVGIDFKLFPMENAAIPPPTNNNSIKPTKIQPMNHPIVGFPILF